LLNDTDETSGSPTPYPPVINSFIAAPDTVRPGQSVILSWDLSGATTVNIHPAIGSAGSSDVEHGIEQVSPTTTTTYTLTAANEAGNTTSSVTVTVTSADETLVGCNPVSGRNQEVDLNGLQLLFPNNACIGCPVKPASFSWSPFKECTRYKFVPAKDAALTYIVAEAEVATTAYEYEGTLDYGASYFWRVMAVKPASSDSVMGVGGYRHRHHAGDCGHRSHRGNTPGLELPDGEGAVSIS